MRWICVCVQHLESSIQYRRIGPYSHYPLDKEMNASVKGQMRLEVKRTGNIQGVPSPMWLGLVCNRLNKDCMIAALSNHTMRLPVPGSLILHTWQLMWAGYHDVALGDSARLLLQALGIFTRGLGLLKVSMIASRLPIFSWISLQRRLCEKRILGQQDCVQSGGLCEELRTGAMACLIGLVCQSCP